MTKSCWDEGSDSDQVTGLRDEGLVGNRRILTLQLAGNHATGVRGRLRFDRSLPKSAYVSLRRKGSQVRQ